MEYKVAVQHGDAKLVTALLIEAQCPEHARTTAIIGDVGVGVRREWPRYGRRAGDKARWAS